MRTWGRVRGAEKAKTHVDDAEVVLVLLVGHVGRNALGHVEQVVGRDGDDVRVLRMQESSLTFLAP